MKKTLIYIIILLIVVGLYSCKVKKAAVKNNNDTIIIDDNTATVEDNKPDNTPTTDKEENNNKENTSDTNEQVRDTTIVEPSYNKKIVYNIALILPLLEDSVNSSWYNHTENDLKDFNFPYQSNKAMHFIEGAMLAAKNLNTYSILNIEIFDNAYSYTRTSAILNKLETRDIDMIIGPMKKQNIQLVSNYAKRKDILMVSPFSPSKTAGSKYYKYIMTEPSIDMHLKSIANYIQDSLQNSSIKILYPNTASGAKNADYFQQTLRSINDSLPLEKKLKYAMVKVAAKTNDRKNFKMADHLDANAKNIVTVLSFNEGFVHSMLTSLNTELENFDIKVFGMPNWKDSKSLRLDYFERLNVHYTSSKWIDDENENTQNFVSNFKQEYKTYPLESAYLAYDIFSFLPIWLEKYGLDLDKNISKEEFSGLLNTYHFEPIDYNIESTATLSPRIENKNLFVISYKNYELKRKR